MTDFGPNVKIRRGWAPERALLLDVQRTVWHDPWGYEVQAKEILSAFIVHRTDKYLPAELEPGTNGTEAVERIVCVTIYGSEFYCIGCDIWKQVGESDHYYYQATKHGHTRYLWKGEPITEQELLGRFLDS